MSAFRPTRRRFVALAGALSGAAAERPVGAGIPDFYGPVPEQRLEVARAALRPG